MRWWISLILSIILIVLIIPALIIKGFSPVDTVNNSPASRGDQQGDNINITRQASEPDVAMYDHIAKKVVMLALEDYVVGAVAAEMPASFELEALKAQAVAARTLAIKKMRAFGGRGCENHPQADVCSMFSHCQAWISDQQMKKNWKENYQANYEKIKKAVEETRGYIITYRNDPIEVFYHSTSNGRTADAGEVFPTSLPYYGVVNSPGEEDSPRYRQTFTFSNQEFVRIFKKRYPKSNLNASNLASQIRIKSYTESGRVKEVIVGGVTVKGTDFRFLYGLNSTDFKFRFEKDSVKIDTTGYGHGVGMSQVGANHMAKQGHTYVDILKHYYKGIEVEKHR